MSKVKKRILNVSLGLVGFVMLVGILFFTLSPGIPTTKLNESGVSTKYLSLPNGDYSGDSVLGFLQGEGTFEFDTGETYTGSWDKHEMNGKGKLTTSLGEYDGNFVNSQKSGKGTFTWTDGTKYDGDWVADKMSGTGKITTSYGATFSGTFDNNVFTDGTINLKSDKATYQITIKEGVIGKDLSATFTSGVTYKGEFSGTSINGEGTMTFPDGGKYVGSFKDGKRNGKGTFTWKENLSYNGLWENDIMDGQGVYRFDATTYISGDFDKGTLNGTYTYKNSDGEFKTVWENGVCSSVTAK